MTIGLGQGQLRIRDHNRWSSVARLSTFHPALLQEVEDILANLEMFGVESGDVRFKVGALDRRVYVCIVVHQDICS